MSVTDTKPASIDTREKALAVLACGSMIFAAGSLEQEDMIDARADECERIKQYMQKFNLKFESPVSYFDCLTKAFKLLSYELN